MLIAHNKVRIVATILARNEEDIIGQNIEHHLSQGVTNFIVTLNRCTDSTKSIVERYPEVVEIIEEDDDTHDQSKWVTRMARLACKLKPDWIVHLDADEFWCGLQKLSLFTTPAISSNRMFLHPPHEDGLPAMQPYLNLEGIPGLPGECKVAHKALENVIITHGNHDVNTEKTFTNAVYRHHYPIRKYGQFERKTKEGHCALMNRNAPCPRWKLWYESWEKGELQQLYREITSHWQEYLRSPSLDALLPIIRVWSTDDVISRISLLNGTSDIVVGRWSFSG